MDFILKIREFIKKLQGLDEKKKKIILWTIVAVIGSIMAFFWFAGVKKQLDSINTEEVFKPVNSFMENSQMPGLETK